MHFASVYIDFDFNDKKCLLACSDETFKISKRVFFMFYFLFCIYTNREFIIFVSIYGKQEFSHKRFCFWIICFFSGMYFATSALKLLTDRNGIRLGLFFSANH